VRLARLRPGANTGLLAAFCLGVVAIGISAYAVKPTTTRSFHLLYGSIFIDDNTSPVAIDLASGKPTVGLHNAFTAVSATSSGDVHMVPLQGATLMLNTATGEFNMLDAAGLLVKATDGGVQLPSSSTSRSSVGTSPAITAIAAGADAYVVRATSDHTEAYLVSQATVADAGTQTRSKARASVVIPSPLETGAAGVAEAAATATVDGALWMICGSGTLHTIRQLIVPPRSNAGATLRVQLHGTVSGVAGIESATTNLNSASPSDTTSQAVAVATSRGLTIFDAAGHSHTLRIAVNGLDQILPVTSLQGWFAFLVHTKQGTKQGWSLLTAPLHGGSAHLRPLPALATATTLLTPAASGTSLYTAEVNEQGQLWQISATGTVTALQGSPAYPLLTGERLDLDGGEVEADGPRVIINSRANLEAEVIFADGSHPPLTIDKHSAVLLDPSSTQALVVSHGAGPSHPATRTKPVTTTPRPVTSVNDKIDCGRTTQTPNIPVVDLVERGSRSVQLSWTYPVLDTQDCIPSTYTVTTQLVAGDAPPPPGPVTVQGQDGVDLVGLFPATTYRLTVTAYLNGRGTSSQPLAVTTSVEGPAAPTDVTTTVDDAGNWQISWQSCGGVSAGCVPTSSWEITPQFCDGAGLSGAPATRLELGDPTQHSFTFTFTGDDSLLGRGLTFDVAGVGATGLLGTPVSDDRCSYSWTPPVTSAISLTASSPPTTAEQDATNTTVAVHFADSAVHDLGGVGGQLTYQLLSGDEVVSSAGPTTQTSVSLGGIRAGELYEVRALVNPPRHPEASAVVGPVEVQPAAAFWPTPTVSASFTDTTSSAGDLSLDIDFPQGTDSHGETFDLTNSSLDCGNAHDELNYSDVTPGQTITFSGISRATYNSQSSPCTVTVALAQDSSSATTPPLYGAGDSAAATSPAVTIDVPTLTTSASDFSASWVAGGDPAAPQVAVSYDGADATVSNYAENWLSTASTATTPNCGTTNENPAGSPATISVDDSCVTASAVWSVTVTFDYFGAHATYTVPVSGTGPAPVDSSKLSFAAAWTATSTVAQPQVEIEYSGPYDDAVLDSLTWTATITSSGSPGTTCGSTQLAPQADGEGPDIDVNLAACPATNGSNVSTYTLHLSYTDQHFGSTGSYQATVSGAAPS
jgi:hypothetical protein